MKSAFLSESTAPLATFLIRLMVGGVFLSEGIQKFLYADLVGSGRFAKIGLPWPEVLGPLVGGTEALFGTLILLGIITRLATLPLLVVMGVALTTTKIPILLSQGFWFMAHAARTDYAMVMGLLFLLISGAGSWSLDAKINGAKKGRTV